jgi:hypothetical protein
MGKEGGAVGGGHPEGRCVKTLTLNPNPLKLALSIEGNFPKPCKPCRF